jgi:hypothetical protein
LRRTERYVAAPEGTLKRRKWEDRTRRRSEYNGTDVEKGVAYLSEAEKRKVLAPPNCRRLRSGASAGGDHVRRRT